MGRALRPRSDRHFRDPGRDHQGDCRSAQGPAAAGGNGGIFGQAPTENVEAYNLYLKGRRIFPQSDQGVPWSCPADVRQGDRARSRLCPCLCRHRQLRRQAGRMVWRANSDGRDPSHGRQGAGARPRAGRSPCRAGRSVAVSRAVSDEARRAFEQALALDPNSFEANLFYARLLHEASAISNARSSCSSGHWRSSPTIIRRRCCFSRSCMRWAGGRSCRYARLGLKRAEEALQLHPESSRPAQLGAAGWRRWWASERGDALDRTRAGDRPRRCPGAIQCRLRLGAAWANSTARFDCLNAGRARRCPGRENWLDAARSRSRPAPRPIRDYQRLLDFDRRPASRAAQSIA